ncbi:zinc finger protein basonuclin-2 [Chaetodon auriga]|uniref:zinc finger protein basonuclin-2 n=1 Tax=Chaetodon auriga TaxID=39042 RepID=UPI004032C45A
MRTTPETEENIRCTVSHCSCASFKPGSVQLRSCDRCGHGWVAHALEKLHFQAQQSSSCAPVEVALPGRVFDLSSLVLYGAHAVPVRLKILLDRLYSVLTPEQVSHILHTLGWTLGDYVRGYMLQFPSGKVFDRWLMVTPEEELLILKQFLRFGETRPIVELMTPQCLAAVNHLSYAELKPAPKSCQSSISMNGGTPGGFRNARGDSRLLSGVCRFKKRSPADHSDTAHHFENFPGGQSLPLPFHCPSSAIHCLVHPTKELVPPSKLPQHLQKPGGTELAETHKQDGGRRVEENNLGFQQCKGEPALKIKADPDKPNTALTIWHPNPQFNSDQEPDLHGGMAEQESTSSLFPSMKSSLTPSSSSLRPSISSSSPPKISQKLQDSTSYPLSPLPSTSFLCPLPTASFSSSIQSLPSPSSSSLHPLPSSLCSLPSLSPAGGRKGRVCCGVCGKSFYDKGTLKIHYNAVHLKIKHRCTVSGCTMVFSSLRSRNRHSANPNPRLHTGAGRDDHTQRNTHTEPHTSIHTEIQIHKTRRNVHDSHTRICREKGISNTLWRQENEAHMLVRVHTMRNRHTHLQHGFWDNTPPPADSPPPSPHSLPQNQSHDTNKTFTLSGSTYRSNLHPQGRPPPPLLPASSASLLGSPPSLLSLVVPAVEKTELHLLSLHANHTPPAHLPGTTPVTMVSCNSEPVSHDYGVAEGKQGGACTSTLTNQQRRWESGDPMPKKKPRKSSMPVKIERGKVEGYEEEEEC